MKILHVHEKQLLSMKYLAEILINEMHTMPYLLLKICLIMISVIFFTKNFLIKLTLRLFLRYSYILGNFHPDILIEAILIKKRAYYFLRSFIGSWILFLMHHACQCATKDNGIRKCFCTHVGSNEGGLSRLLWLYFSWPYLGKES